jgi:DNA-directed RNA polymerase specialized sigma24 family protein
VLSSRETREGEADAVVSGTGLSAYEEQRLARRLNGLPYEVLQCLSLWAGSDYETDDLSILLRIPENLVRERLSYATNELGRSLEQLRTPEVARSVLRRLGNSSI